MTSPRLVLAAVLAAPMIMITGIAPAGAADLKYSSCDDLNRVYPYGVAKNSAAAARQVREGNRRPSTSARAKKVYAANKANLDRDKDGTACEGS